MSSQGEMPSESSEAKNNRISIKGRIGLVCAIGIVAALLAEEATRGFVFYSLVLGSAIGAVLYLWHKRHPLL